MTHSDSRFSRRRMLQWSASGGLAAGLLAELEQVRWAFSDRLLRNSSQLDSNDDFVALREDYLLDPAVRYLNHASIGTVPRAVHEARVEYARVCETNPWLHIWGGVWEGAREETRQRAAALMSCRPTEVAITHNTTEFFNVLAQGLPLGEGDEVLFSSLCHTGASRPFAHQAPQRGFSVRRFQFPAEAAPDMAAADVVAAHAEAISDATRLLVVPHLDNTYGIRHPLKELAAMAHDRGVDYLAVDAAQTIGMIEVNVAECGIDFLATSPHKWLQAPKGLGLAFIRESLLETVRPMWVTWGQDQWSDSARKFEDYGTRNLPEVLALDDAIRFHLSVAVERRESRLIDLWQTLLNLTDDTPGARWRSPRDWALSGSLVAVEFEGRSSGELARQLFADHGIVVRPFQGNDINALRISPNLFNDTSDLEALFEVAAG